MFVHLVTFSCYACCFLEIVNSFEILLFLLFDVCFDDIRNVVETFDDDVVGFYDVFFDVRLTRF